MSQTLPVLALGAVVLMLGSAARVGAQCEVAQLVEPVPSADPGFGRDVALDARIAVVGNATGPFGSSPSWVFELGSDGWSQGSPLPPDGLVTTYGASVDVSGDTLVVAGQDLDDELVAAYVFERVGGSWIKSDELLLQGAFWQLSPGLAVAIEQDTIVVADQNFNSAFVFERAAGGWTLAQTLAPAWSGSFGSYGFSVSLRAGRLVIGGCADNAGEWCVGTAWVYEQQGGVFVETAQLLTSGGEPEDYAGTSVAQTDDTIVLGAPGHDLGFPGGSIGAAFVFELEAGAWSQTAMLSPPAPKFGDAFGGAVAVQGDVLLAGAPHRDDGAFNAGAVFVYHRLGAAWELIATLHADEPAEHANYGESLALDGDTLLVGAESASSLGEDRVHVVQGVPGLVDWTPVAGAVAGSAGTPCSFGAGAPAVGGGATVTLVQALPSTTAWLVLGLDRINAPFKGGVLVPAPELLIPLLTDGAGVQDFGWTWPPGLPPGLVLWLQHWVVDAGAPFGLAGSNGLRVEVP